MASSVPAEATSYDAPSLHVSLTPHLLSPTSVLDSIRSPHAGALVLFAGTTRSTFDSRPVTHLSYSAYIPLALRTLRTIAEDIKQKHQLIAISIEHRLGTVPIGEESILIAVSAAHRGEAWRAGEEALEACKEKVEVWKLEVFEGDEGVWRANRDGARGVRIDGERGGEENAGEDMGKAQEREMEVANSKDVASSAVV